MIDIRYGDVYRAETVVEYSSGVKYQVRIEADVATRTYSAFVTPEGEVERSLAIDASFRSTQCEVTSLIHWVAWNAEDNSFRQCGFETVVAQIA
jgi:hypothetical protein